jgi:predicted nucleic acid-binding protein
MNLDLPAGSRCFVDANIIAYHFVEYPPFTAPSSRFFRRIANGDFTAFTSDLVVSEALHKIMLSDVQKIYAAPKPLAYVQRHPEIIATLANYRLAAIAIPLMKLTILPCPADFWPSVYLTAADDALLTNDAAILTLMRRHNIHTLATNDDDFKSIHDIDVRKPL